MKNIFVYGPLVDRDVMDDISCCILPRERGTLHGYSCHQVKGTEYKGIVFKDGMKVEGAVYFNVPRTSMARVQKYLGEIYVRDTVVVEMLQGEIIEAEVFVVRRDYVVMLDLQKEEICTRIKPY